MSAKQVQIGKQNEPMNLYDIAINVVGFNYKEISSKFNLLVFPPEIYFDILYGLYINNFYKDLHNELTKLETINKALKASSKRLKLHRSFQAIMDLSFYSNAAKPSRILADVFVDKLHRQRLLLSQEGTDNQIFEHLTTEGLRVSMFLSEAGWLEEAEIILLQCKKLLIDADDPKYFLLLLECYQRLLHVQNGFCHFKQAEETVEETMLIINKLKVSGYNPNLTVLYSEFSTLYMLRSDYAKAYSWSLKALQEVVPNMHQPALVDVLRQAAKSCVLKREFKKAGLLIKEAFKIARELFISGERSLKYADTLIDFGFYLLNVDAISQGIEVYQTALNVRQNVFGPNSKNLHIATAYEDLSYASYVFNYTIGLFQEARSQAEKALSLLNCLLPKDHLLFSSCKRVKALILEEMAIEDIDSDIEAKYLEEAHCLHNEALRLALEAFGEMNVQTAKHYGNLGRLYQSMKRFNDAEEMHLKAINIKETLLGPEDYEVALSVGHLASLYNYDLGYYAKAEMLYRRSIQIGKKLFGEAYSGLEYDYRGLLRVYTNQSDIEKRQHYFNVLCCWKEMRQRMEEAATSPFSDLNEPLSVALTLQQFMAL